MIIMGFFFLQVSSQKHCDHSDELLCHANGIFYADIAEILIIIIK